MNFTRGTCSTQTPESFSTSRFIKSNEGVSSPLCTVPCQVPGRSLWFGRAKLFDDVIVLSGWEWTGRYERRIPIRKVENAGWYPREQYNLILRLEDDSRRVLDLTRHAGVWYWELKGLLGDSTADSPPVPPDGKPTTGSPRERD